MEERETHLGTIVFPSREQILQMGVLTHTELQDTWSELLSVAVPFTPEGFEPFDVPENQYKFHSEASSELYSNC